MNKNKLLFVGIITSLVVSSAVLTNNFNYQKNKLESAAIEGGQLYVQIRNELEVNIGDTIIFGCDSWMYSGHGGNPVYSVGRNVDGYNEDYSKFYFASSKAIPWIVEAGVDAYSTYSFKATTAGDSEFSTLGRYLAFGTSFIDSTGTRYSTDGGIITSTTKDANSSWILQFDNEHYVHMQKSDEEYVWSEGATNYTEIEYSGIFGYFHGFDRIRMYRKVDLTKGVDIYVSEDGNKKSYVHGETTNLEGLELTVRFLDHGDDYICSYENEPNFFEPETASYATQRANFNWLGFESSYSCTVAHDTSSIRYYEKTNSKLYDPRGTHLIGLERTYVQQQITEHTCALNVSALTTTPAIGGYVTLYDEFVNDISDSVYNDAGDTIKNNDVCNNLVQIVVNDNGNDDKTDDYYLKYNNNYIYYCDNGQLKIGSIAQDQAARITLDDENHILFDQGSKILAFVRGSYQNAQVVDYSAYESDPTNYYLFQLYKLKFTDNISETTELNNFKNEFFEKTADFDKTGLTRDLSVAAWNELAALYEDLSLDVKGYLGNITYTHNDTEEDSFEELADIYDSIIGIYYDRNFNDFMDRDRATTLNYNRDVTYACTNCAIEGPAKAAYQDALNLEIELNEGFTYPENIAVKMGGNNLREEAYTYDNETGEITINQNVIVDDIEIIVDADTIKCCVTYVSGDGSGDDYVVNNITYNNSISLADFADTGFTAPQGKRFKAWKIAEDEYDEGETYVVTDNVVITAIYETIPVIAEIENLTTYPTLYYKYDFDGENYTFSDVTIRFNGVISKTLWEELDGDDHNIIAYGSMLSTAAYLDENEAELKAYFENPDGTNVKKFTSSQVIPATVAAGNYGATAESYIWNLRKYVSNTTIDLTTEYVATIYILTRDYGPIFLNQVTTSVKDLAQEMMIEGHYDETSFEGSLNYLATL